MRERKQKAKQVPKEAQRGKKENAPKQTYAANRKRGFLIATLLFVVFLLFAAGVKRAIKDEVLVSEQDITRLSHAVDQVEQEIAISKLEEVVNTAVPLSCALQKILAKFIAAADAEDAQKMQNLEKAYRVLPSLASSVARAGDTLYTKLQAMLLEDPEMPLIGIPRYLPRTFFRYMAAALYINAIALPDYHLHRTESTADHTRSLVRAWNLLQWTEKIRHPSFFNWTASPCHKAFDGGATEHWVQFCDTSLTSSLSTRVRAAAVEEELIALDSSYAPFRAHYAATMTLLDSPRVDPTVILSGIRKQKEGLAKKQFKNVETFHAPLLDVLEAFAIPLNLIDYHLVQRTERALAHFPTCAALRDPFSSRNTSAMWPGKPFLKERRAPLLLHRQVDALVDKLSHVLSDEKRALLDPLRNCTA